MVVDNQGCNGNEDINFRFTGWAINFFFLTLCAAAYYACTYSGFGN